MSVCARRGCDEADQLSRAGRRSVCLACRREFLDCMGSETLPRVEMARRLDDFLQTTKPEPEIRADDLFDD